MLSPIQKLVLAFVTLMVGVVLVGQIASTTSERTTKTGLTDTTDISTAWNTVRLEANNVSSAVMFNATLANQTVWLPTVTANTGRNLNCTNLIITNKTTGAVATGNYTWATLAQVRGRCGIVFNDTNKPDDTMVGLWNFTYNVSYQTMNTSLQFTISQVPTGWKVADCPITSIVVSNGSDNLVLDTDYNYSSSNGKYTFLPSVTNNLSGSVSYETSFAYCDDSYLNSSWGRTVIDLTPGFFALALLAISAGLFYSLAKDANLI